MNVKIVSATLAVILVASPIAAEARDSTNIYALRTGTLPEDGPAAIIAAPGSVDTGDIEARIKTTLKERGYTLVEDPGFATTIVNYRSSKSGLGNFNPIFGVEPNGAAPGDTHYRLAISVSQPGAPATWLGYADDYTPAPDDDALSFDILWDELEPFWGRTTPAPEVSL